jgi:hypothetical protein
VAAGVVADVVADVAGDVAELLTEGATLLTLDAYALPPTTHYERGAALAEGRATARVLPHADGRVPNGAVGWFECELHAGVRLSSAPDSQTHWRQVAYSWRGHRCAPLCAPVATLSYRVDEEGVEVTGE